MRKKKPEFTGKMKLKKGDEVMILAGKDKGKSGKVIETLPEEGKVRVEGVNLAKKHQKPRSTNSRSMVKQQLGEVQFPMGLPLAKVMLVCPKCNKETKLASERNNEGKNVRKCRKCGELIDG